MAIASAAESAYRNELIYFSISTLPEYSSSSIAVGSV
jgi:hypothetical protein